MACMAPTAWEERETHRSEKLGATLHFLGNTQMATDIIPLH